jgi:hypothetical protein
MPAPARAVLAVLVLALFAFGGIAAVDQSATDVNESTTEGSTADNVSDDVTQLSDSSFSVLQLLVYPAAVLVILSGLQMFTRL